jgi:hypothetical protein
VQAIGEPAKVIQLRFPATSQGINHPALPASHVSSDWVETSIGAAYADQEDRAFKSMFRNLFMVITSSWKGTMDCKYAGQIAKADRALSSAATKELLCPATA